MNDLKNGINNMVKEATKQPTVEESKKYLTGKGFNLAELDKDNYSGEIKRLGISDFDDELISHMNTYGKYREDLKNKQLAEQEKTLPPINFEEMFDKSGGAGKNHYVNTLEEELNKRPNTKEYAYDGYTFKHAGKDTWGKNLFNAYQNGNLVNEKQKLGSLMHEIIQNKRLGTINTQDILKKAKKEFGTTSRFKSSFYMLPSGELLDGSGGTGYGRGDDHRAIKRIYPELGFEYAGDYLIDFQKRGGIRVIPESQAVELETKPSEQQIAQIMRYARMGYITAIETPDGEYYEDINPAQLNAILKSIQ